jgi:hypothetical protein
MATKLELTQLLATRNSELESARLRISVLEGELALRPRLSAPTEARLRYLASRNVERAPSDFALRCAAAKAAAMAGGKAVRV